MSGPAPTFEPISTLSPGGLAGIIRRSYAGLIAAEPDRWSGEIVKWEDFDRQAFANPDTIGLCVFVTRLGPEPVGLASFDPRPAPAHGEIGQNCVLPGYRGRGLGSLQIAEVLRRFRALAIREARVTTSVHPFFAPARRMYEGLGFREVRRFAGGPDPRYPLLEFVLRLGRSSELDG
jgi:ribosomal protein S18 acetylase RimI-like enzyme